MFRTFVFIAALLTASPSAQAIIRVDVRISAIYDVAKLVMVGKVARVDQATRTVRVDVVEVCKGDLADRSVTLLLGGIGDYIRLVEQDQPVVIFNGVRGATIHLADNYLAAESLSGSNPPTWKVTRKNPIQTRFPGRTAAVVKVVAELKANHSTLVNAIEHTVWRGGIESLGKVLAHADYVIAADLTGDGKAEVLLGNEKATQALLNTPAGLVDKTADAGLREARGKWAASGDINKDGRHDLLIGRTLWINTGGHFLKGPVLEGDDELPCLTAALIDITGDGAPDVVFLTNTGMLFTFRNPGNSGGDWKALPARALWSGDNPAIAASFSTDWGDTGKAHVMVVRPSGVTRYALDPDGGPPAEFERLCGETLESFNRLKNQTRWNVAGAVALDINGDGRMDFITFHDDGGPTFVDRGFGTFLLSTEPAVAIRSYKSEEVPWVVTAGTRFGAGDIDGDKFDDLLVATEDGQLFELKNTPYRPFAD